MRFDIVTLFPEIFSGFVGESLLRKAIDKRRLEVVTHDLRNWSKDKHQKVDDRPYGGGPGMVIKVEPVVECIEEIRRLHAEPGELILLTPQGERLTQPLVEQLAEFPRLILLCGRYEGFDQRVVDLLQPRELSIGDYVLNGGEVAAMVVIDTVMRLIPGVLGDEQSARSDSFSQENRGLEAAQYTRPRSYRGCDVPEVLLSGDHAEIDAWRQSQSYHKTLSRRADLVGSEGDSPRRPETNEGEKREPVN
ncbi:MAG: tRNA (guanosine(37)-N1)-methyltransferase TrmD [Planctomycetes bacterium]|nr:tRNA (guanosine(37)-N1)-methyltransferase TrmD [Planctomycetota bacterium]